jgi:hypothetical protein
MLTNTSDHPYPQNRKPVAIHTLFRHSNCSSGWPDFLCLLRFFFTGSSVAPTSVTASASSGACTAFSRIRSFLPFLFFVLFLPSFCSLSLRSTPTALTRPESFFLNSPSRSPRLASHASRCLRYGASFFRPTYSFRSLSSASRISVGVSPNDSFAVLL